MKSAYTPAERRALHARWARNRAEREAAAPPPMTTEELHQRADAALTRRKAELSNIAATHRRLQAEAAAHGDKENALTLGMLAAIGELNATKTEAERSDSAAKFARWQFTYSNRDLAKRKRPGRRTALRDLMDETLGPLKREGIAFRTLLQRWRRERIGSLRLDDLGGGHFRVTDENGDDDAHAPYTRGYLEKLYSMSR